LNLDIIKYNITNDQTTTVINLPAAFEEATPIYKYKLLHQQTTKRLSNKGKKQFLYGAKTNEQHNDYKYNEIT